MLRFPTLLARLTSWAGSSLAALLSAGCSSLESRFYQPQAIEYAVPPGVEERMVTAEDGTRLQTWFLPSPSLRDGLVDRAPLVVICPGSRTQIDELTPLLRPIAMQADVSLLLLNYRGYGRSEAKTSVTRRTTLIDARAVLDHAFQRADVDPRRIALMGYSLGSVPALALAAQSTEVPAVVIGGVYGRASDVLADSGYGSLTWLIGSNHDPVDSASGMTGRPVFLFHGEEDRDVPPYHALELGAALLRSGADLELHLVANRNHYDVLAPESSLNEDLIAFLRKTLHGKGEASAPLK